MGNGNEEVTKLVKHAVGDSSKSQTRNKRERLRKKIRTTICVQTMTAGQGNDRWGQILQKYQAGWARRGKHARKGTRTGQME